MTYLDAIPYAVAGAIAFGAGGYILHCEHVKKDRAAFIADLESKAHDQKKRIAAIQAQNKDAKELADETEKKLRADLAATAKRLRDERSRSNILPPASPASKRPLLACFDRAELTGAIRVYEEGVAGLLGEGVEGAIALNAARLWALNTAGRNADNQNQQPSAHSEQPQPTIPD